MKKELYKFFKALDVTKLLEEDLEELLQYFRVTKDSRIRNQIAFIFMDTKYEAAVPFILEKIHDKSLPEVGSLVYALSAFDMKPHFLIIVKIGVQFEYEPRMGAYHILLYLVNDVSDAQRKEAYEWLLDYKAKMEPLLTDKGTDSAWHFIQAIIALLEL